MLDDAVSSSWDLRKKRRVGIKEVLCQVAFLFPIVLLFLRQDIMSVTATATKVATGYRLGSDEEYKPALKLADFDKYTFKPIRESEVNREMTSRYMTDMLDYAETDVVVVGCGSANLSCAWELSKDPNIKVRLHPCLFSFSFSHVLRIGGYCRAERRSWRRLLAGWSIVLCHGSSKACSQVPR